MSGRLYRKVVEEHEQVNKVEANVSAEEMQGDVEDVDDPDFCAPSVNLFNLLDDNDENDQFDEPNEGNDGSVETVYKSGFASSTANKKSKRRKKKKKSKEKLSTNGDDGFTGSLVVDFKALCLKTESSHEASSILNVDFKFLNAEYELRKIFGSEVVSQFENANHTGPSRQGRGGKRGGCTHTNSLFAPPSEHWLRWDGSLSMELLESKAGNHYFRYVRSSSYNQAQKAFESSKEYDDMNGMASILMQHPYHVESLLTLADYFRLSGEYQMAADFIAKCLYALESAWHPMFSPLQGNCKLKYTDETNKPFFVSLFNHMRNLDRRGCHRSALEVCKLLLSLDPSDPMGAMFCIDYFALRAEEYAWLERFSEAYQSDHVLWSFPNFAYSLAVCRFYLDGKASSKDGKIDQGKATAIGLMKQALMLHPSVLKRLVEKVPLRDRAWTTITKTSIFKSQETGIPSLDHLIRIYVERSYIIWRLPDVHKLLKEAAVQVVETLKHNSIELDTWACVRYEAFPSQKNEYIHLLVSDFSDAVVAIPPNELQNSLVVDPWMDDTEWNQNYGLLGPVGAARLANRSQLAVLLESILPWVPIGIDVYSNPDQPYDDHSDSDHSF
ncbi:hypothetical protein vseg_006900 [Gypsophila vaccaria]